MEIMKASTDLSRSVMDTGLAFQIGANKNQSQGNNPIDHSSFASPVETIGSSSSPSKDSVPSSGGIDLLA